ncbi:unnamed protein product [Ostreobium quekettii]|uniref:Uncharacterized protein n=1 Tax=Ostreobium quekettii TaxID=121088 RepID=A0A8S1IS98_9CHLO|nr:unnamed protein product [Ostreobium quekettii]|eukprot:evm.model.scf_469.7 EVM.evm.TU.scf_469.7   scf_469:52098-52511(+)
MQVQKQSSGCASSCTKPVTSYQFGLWNSKVSLVLAVGVPLKAHMCGPLLCFRPITAEDVKAAAVVITRAFAATPEGVPVADVRYATQPHAAQFSSMHTHPGMHEVLEVHCWNLLGTCLAKCPDGNLMQSQLTNVSVI